MERWADKTHREPEPRPENRIRTHAWDAREIIPPLQLREPVPRSHNGERVPSCFPLLFRFGLRTAAITRRREGSGG